MIERHGLKFSGNKELQFSSIPTTVNRPKELPVV
jgi:hypothetical protein